MCVFVYSGDMERTAYIIPGAQEGGGRSHTKSPNGNEEKPLANDLRFSYSFVVRTMQRVIVSRVIDIEILSLLAQEP